MITGGGDHGWLPFLVLVIVFVLMSMPRSVRTSSQNDLDVMPSHAANTTDAHTSATVGIAARR